MNENDKRVMRLLIKMYQAGWKDAIDSLIAAKHTTCNPMEEIYKLLLEENNDKSSMGDSSSVD